MLKVSVLMDRVLAGTPPPFNTRNTGTTTCVPAVILSMYAVPMIWSTASVDDGLYFGSLMNTIWTALAVVSVAVRRAHLNIAVLKVLPISSDDTVVAREPPVKPGPCDMFEMNDAVVRASVLVPSGYKLEILMGVNLTIR